MTREKQIRKLTIMAYNVNSLISPQKKEYFSQFLKKTRPDITLISETLVTGEHTIGDNNYRTFRKDKIEGKRGTAICIDYQIARNAKEIDINGLKCFEATAVVIPIRSKVSLTLISIYKQFRAKQQDIKDDLDLLKRFLSETTYGIIGGDFNARHPKWMDVTSDPNGECIAKWLDNNYNQHSLKIISQPDHTYPSTPSTLDFFIATSNLVSTSEDDYADFCTTLTTKSDHKAVFLSIHYSLHQLTRQDFY